MLLSIRHETRYDYDTPVAYSIQRLYLTAQSFDGQRVVSWTIDAPGMANAMRYRDGFGNIVHVITSSGLHDHVSIVAEGTVEVEDKAGVVRGLSSTVPDAVFLRQTRATQPNAAIKSLASEADRSGPNVLDKLHVLMRAVAARITYQTGTTDTGTTAAQAIDAGRGVCQDHAHVFLSAARHLGIPARFVTGYLATGVGVSSEAGHAWAEALTPDLGWVGFDPANGQCPTADYVRVACGLDAAGITPVRGSRRGGIGEKMNVGVKVALAEQ